MTEIDKKSPIPIYIQLKNILKENILLGMFRNSGNFPSENVLGSQYSMNRLTARRALIELEREGLIYTVQGKGRFISDREIQRPATATTSSKDSVAIVGFTELDIAHSVYAVILTKLMRILHEQNKEVKFMTCKQFRQVKEVSDLGTTQLLLCLASDEIPFINRLQAKGIFVTAINRPMQGSGIPYVAIDQYSGTYQLVKNMINAGHRNIACICGNIKKNKYMQERIQAFRDAFKISDLNFNPAYILELDSPDENYRPALDKFFRENKNISALFMTGEVYQEQPLKYLMDNGLRIPEDISAAAIDEPMSDSFLPKITHVRQPMEELAVHAVKILNEVSASGNPSAERGELLYPSICDNGSIKNIR